MAFGLVAVYKPKLFEFWWPLDYFLTALVIAWLSGIRWALMCWANGKNRKINTGGKKMEIKCDWFHVSCLPLIGGPLRADHRVFFSAGLPNRELIILDDGTDAIGDLWPIPYPLPAAQIKIPVGAKQNWASEARGR